MTKKTIKFFICQNYVRELKNILSGFTELDYTIHPLKATCYVVDKSVKYSDMDFLTNGFNLLLIGSNCHKPIVEMAKKKENQRIVKEEQCFDFILPANLVKYYNSDGAYLISPGWLQNWSEYIKEWGFDQKTAQMFFKESCRYLLLLDSGVWSDSKKTIKKLSDFLEIEYKILPVGLEFFQQKITSEIQTILYELSEGDYKPNNNQKNYAEFVMTLDLINGLSKNKDETSLIKDIINLLNMLFAPLQIFYQEIDDNNRNNLFDINAKKIVNNLINKELSNLDKDFEILDKNEGFKFVIDYDSNIMAKVLIRKVAHPEYFNHYLNLILYIKKLLGLTISNVRSSQEIKRQSEILKKQNLNHRINEIRYRKAQEAGKVGNWEFDIKSQKFWGSCEALKIHNIDPGKEFVTFEDVESEIVEKEMVHQALFDLININKTYDLIYHIHAENSKDLKTIKSKAVIEKNGTGEACRIIGVIQDISEQVEQERQLKIRDEKIEIISRILWHDVSNSFAAIKSALRVFNRSKDLDALDYASGLVDKGVKMINRMRLLQKSLKENIELEEVNAAKVVKSIIKNYKIKISVSGKCSILADDAFYSVVDNIISNAIRHGKADNVTVSLSEDQEYSYIEIADNGIGIKDEIKSKVFDEKFIAGKTGNTGIGLYIVKRTIQRYGGEVFIRDNYPSGAVFVLRFNRN